MHAVVLVQQIYAPLLDRPRVDVVQRNRSASASTELRFDEGRRLSDLLEHDVKELRIHLHLDRVNYLVIALQPQKILVSCYRVVVQLNVVCNASQYAELLVLLRTNRLQHLNYLGALRAKLCYLPKLLFRLGLLLLLSLLDLVQQLLLLYLQRLNLLFDKLVRFLV